MIKIIAFSLLLIVTFCTKTSIGIPFKNGEKKLFYKKQTQNFTVQNNVVLNNTKNLEGEYCKNENMTSLYSDDLKILFSSTPFSEGNPQLANNFTTRSKIYAKITTENSSIQQLLKITDNDDGIQIFLVLYNEAGDQLKKFVSIAETFQLTAAQSKGKSITLDILPDAEKFNKGKQSDFYVGGAFAYGHNEYNFTQNGIYKVGLFVTNEKVDDFGKPVYGDDIVYVNYFSYNFSAKDAADIVQQSQLISEAKNNAIKNEITPLPKQWVEKSSSTVMGFTQAQLIAMYESSFTNKMDPHTVVKFHASSSNGGWTIQNNEFGIPTYRYSNQWYTIFVKYSNGGACYYQGFGLRQQYNGGGTYGKAYIDKNDYHMLDCAKMK